MTPKWSGSAQNVPKSPQKTNHPKMTVFRSQNGPKWPSIARDRVKNGSKRVKKIKVKSGQKRFKRHLDLHKMAYETLKIHSTHFQIHPLTAHFHTLKRRFWPFLRGKTWFIAENKGLFLHNFAYFWWIWAEICIFFALSCIILLKFAVNFAKHH